MEKQQRANINDTVVVYSVHTELSMIDGKMVDLIQGDSGSFCHYCNVTWEEANYLVCICKSFQIEKLADDTIIEINSRV